MSLEAFMNAIGTLESGNNYGAIGPHTGSRYGRARGRYQIMETIWPAWAREAGIGGADWRDPAAQDRVAKYKMSQYYRQFGSWDLVAVAWFAGPGRAAQAKKQGLTSVGQIRDVLGTSVTGYVAKTMKLMGEGAGSGISAAASAAGAAAGAAVSNMGGAAGSKLGALVGSTQNPNLGAVINPDTGEAASAGEQTAEERNLSPLAMAGIVDMIASRSSQRSGSPISLRSLLGESYADQLANEEEDDGRG